MDQELSANHDSDFTSAASSGTIDDDSYYVEARKNSPARLDNSPDIETFIEEILQMHDDVNTVLKEFSTPRGLFDHPHKLEITKIAGAETTQV